VKEQCRYIETRTAKIRLPAYIPVTTFGDKYPLDKLVGPYLPRLAPAIMVSYHYAQQMLTPPRLPIFVDSGGFASLFKGARIERQGEVGVLSLTVEGKTERIHPSEILDLQEKIADVAFTLDFPIPPNLSITEAVSRMELTMANAQWALANRRRRDLLMFACIQACDASSARDAARAYAKAGFDGLAIGGLVPRSHDWQIVQQIVEAVLGESGSLPVHVFGLGKPDLVTRLFNLGIHSVDSSPYVKLAAEGKLWKHGGPLIQDPSPLERVHLALCNLAMATGTTLPLTATNLVFRSSLLKPFSHETPNLNMPRDSG
jgi:hypothetical protein